MSHKDVENSKIRMVPAQPIKPKKEPIKFVDEVKPKVTKQDFKSEAVEFHFKDRGELTNDTNSSYAMRKEDSRGRIEYFVKFATAGPGTGRMLNPWGVYFNAGDEFKYETQMGRKRYEFLKVDKEVFEAYLHFLKTRNERYILMAEREINNGR